MGSSVYRVLIYSYNIIDSLPLTVGQLIEEVLEASHEQYKHKKLVELTPTQIFLTLRQFRLIS